MHGKVEVESKLGVGTVFSLTFRTFCMPIDIDDSGKGLDFIEENRNNGQDEFEYSSRGAE